MLLVAVALVYAFLFVLFRRLRPSSSLPLPPSPSWSFPLLGHAVHLSKEQPFKKIDQWSKALGDVMTVNFGMDSVIVISRQRLLGEAFVRQGANFAGRPSLFVHESCWGKGIVIRDGKEANRLRSFVLSTIRQRMARESDSVQSLVTRETCLLVERLRERISSSSLSHSTTSIEDDLFFVVGNVMTQLTFGRRFPHGSEEFKDNAAWLTTTTELMERTALITFLPWLRWMPYFKYFEMKEKAAEVHATMMEDVRGRRKSGEYLDEEKCDLVSVFMRKVDEETKREERKKRKETEEERKKRKETEEESLFTDDMLGRITTELFFAGIQTECNTFGWAFLYLAMNEDVQEKCRGQIHEELGREGEVRWDNRLCLPYLEAVIAETQRCANVAPFGLFHKNHEEAVLDGYRIPAGSIVMMNLYSTLTDPEVFPDPHRFLPERFLNIDGSIDSSVMRASVPYGMGSRICMGETIARTELFTVIGTLLQKFRFSLIPGRIYSCEQKMQLTIQAEKYSLRIDPV